MSSWWSKIFPPQDFHHIQQVEHHDWFQYSCHSHTVQRFHLGTDGTLMHLKLFRVDLLLPGAPSQLPGHFSSVFLIQKVEFKNLKSYTLSIIFIVTISSKPSNSFHIGNIKSTGSRLTRGSGSIGHRFLTVQKYVLGHMPPFPTNYIPGPISSLCCGLN